MSAAPAAGGRKRTGARLSAHSFPPRAPVTVPAPGLTRDQAHPPCVPLPLPLPLPLSRETPL